MNKAIPYWFILLLCVSTVAAWGQVPRAAATANDAYTYTGSLNVQAGFSGNIYIDGKLICPISAGESKVLEGISTGYREVELRGAKGSIKQTVTIYPDDYTEVRFIEDLTHKGLVYVDGGSFQMGDPNGNGHKDERPQHYVSLSPFYIAKYEVSQKQFKDVMGYNTSWFTGSANPVEMVSWYEAVEFCNKLSIAEGLEPAYTINKTIKDADNYQPEDNLKWRVDWNPKANGYRLPTEAEWEFAARGGAYSKGYAYAGYSDPYGYAQYYDYDKKQYPRNPSICGNFKPNELGLYDMGGNVYEWCWDWYGDYSIMAQNNPAGPKAGNGRVIRGGSWYSNKSKLRVFQRGFELPDRYYNVIGIRLARSSGAF